METQTAVEWLVEQLKEYDFADIKDNEYYIIKIPTWILKEKEIQALEMEKEQIIDALFFGIHLEYNKIDSPLTRAEQYYSETYEK